MKKLLVGLLMFVALVVIGGLLLPGTVHLERETVIDAPPSKIFALLNSYKRFNEWSPWSQIDPEGTTYEYGGAERGVGAKMSWTSEHRDVGSGSQEIVSTTPNEEVLTALDFGPQGTADAFFRLSPADSGGTRVVWGFDSEMGMNPIGRIFGFFFLGKMLGPQYEQGLENLKKLAESLPEGDWTGLDIEVTKAEPVTIAYVAGSSDPDPIAIGGAYATAYGKVMAFVGEQGLAPAGQPLAIHKGWDAQFEFEAGIPVQEAPDTVAEDSEVQIGETYGGEVVKAVHVGSYPTLGETYNKVVAYMAAYGLEQNGDSWDVFISDPTTVPEDEVITHVYYPVK